MKSSIILIVLLFSCLNEQASGQTWELTQLKNDKALTYSTTNSPKSQGLIATIKYPLNYIPRENTHPNTIQGFGNKYEFLLYALAINGIGEKLDSSFLFESYLKQIITTVTPEASFIKYKKGFEIDGMPAAYIEFSTIISDDFFSYCRFYFIISDNYFIGINFTMGQKDGETKAQLLLRFKKYDAFFISYSNTLKIIR